MRLSLVAAPDGEPIIRTEVIAHLRLEADTEEDMLLDALASAAREYAEAVTARQILTATWQVTLDRFPRNRTPLELPLPPLQSVTSIKYLDTAGVLQTWASNQYVVDKPQGPRAMDGRIYPVFGVVYPQTICREDAVTIEFLAGYGDIADVPLALKQAMLLIVGHWYENRENVVIGQVAVEVPLAAEALLGPFTRLSEAMR